MLLVVCLILLNACVVVGQHKGTDEEIAKVNVDLAAEYYRQDRLDIALANLKKALDADASSVEANTLIALVYNRLDEKSLAQEHFEIALEHVASDTVSYGLVHNNYGAFLCANEQYLDAEEHFLLSVGNKLNQNPDAAYENAGLCFLKRPDLEKAHFYFEKALEINPKMPRAILELAEIDFQLKKYGQAQSSLLRFHKINEAVSQSLWLSVKVETAMGNKDKAQKLLTQLKRDFPASKEVANIAGDSLVIDQ